MKNAPFRSDSENSYLEFLRSSFEVHYQKGTDVWTQDRSLQNIALYANRFLPQCGSVLDVGMGRGRDATYFLSQGHPVSGVDLFEAEEVKQLKKISRFHFQRGHFQELSLQRRFDLVLDNGSFHHQDPKDFLKYLKNIFFHLKAGGHFVISVYTPFDPSSLGREGHLSDGRKGRSFSMQELRSLVESAGFEYVDSQRYLHESGKSYYLAASFCKPIQARVLLMTPLTRTVSAACNSNCHTTSLWHDLSDKDPLYPVLSDVRHDSNTFLSFDLKSDFGIQKAIETLKDMELTHGVYNGPDEYLSAMIKIFSALGLLQNPESTFRIMHNKDLLRRHLLEVGLSPVRTQEIRNIGDLNRAHQAIGFPMILKPSSGGGSKDIQLLKEAQDLLRAAQTLDFQKTPLFIAEEFLEGLQVSVEAVTHGEGSHKIIGITEKFEVLSPYFVERGGIFPARVDSQTQRAVEDLVIAMLNSLNYNSGGSHTELILTQNGPKIIETHARIGGLIPFLVQGAMGISIEECMLNSKLASEVPLQNQEIALLQFVELPQGLRVNDIEKSEQLSALPFVVRHNLWVKKGQLVPPTINNDTRHGYVVVKGQDLKSLETNAKTALSLIASQVKLEEVLS